MSVTVVLTLKAKPESFGDLKALMTEILPDTAAYNGAELISCAANEEDHSIQVWEVWDKVESQQAYLGWRAERGDVARIVALCRDDPHFANMTHMPF